MAAFETKNVHSPAVLDRILPRLIIFYPFLFRHLELKSLSCLLHYKKDELNKILVEICPKWNGPEDPEKLNRIQANHLKNHIGKKHALKKYDQFTLDKY